MEILLGGVLLLGMGGKFDEELFWQFDSFVMLKTGWVIKLWWGDSTVGKNNWIFGYCGGPQSSSGENPDMRIEKSWFTFYYKTFWVYIRNNKKYLVMNIWKHTIEHKFQKKYFCKQFSKNLSMMVQQVAMTWTKFQRLSFYCFSLFTKDN